MVGAHRLYFVRMYDGLLVPPFPQQTARVVAVNVLQKARDRTWTSF